jgi:predicted DNA-binding protein (MmcQ/YjbR family)
MPRKKAAKATAQTKPRAQKKARAPKRTETKAARVRAAANARPKRKTHPRDAVLLELRAFGLAYPEAHTKSPWPGHLDLAVRDKTFAYLSLEGEPLRVSCKLPESAMTALTLPHVQPAGYGLGKSGWVAGAFPDDEIPPIDLLKSWIDESYRAQAPKKLAAMIGGAEPLSGAAKGGRRSQNRPARRDRAAPRG